MNIEIERRFLVDPTKLPPLPPPMDIHQGYTSDSPVTRYRIAKQGPDRLCTRTVKGAGLLVREEQETVVSLSEALVGMSQCQWALRKLRYLLRQPEPFAHLKWEVDNFIFGAADSAEQDTSLWLAEVELSSEDEPFDRPDWILCEVTEDPRYTNIELAKTNKRPPSL